MEVRCGQCNKLFRVSDDKITGKGVKFACTRCGEYVKITMEAFEQYSRSKVAEPLFEGVGASTEPAPSIAQESGFAPATAQAETGAFDLQAPAQYDVAPEEQSLFAEPASSAEVSKTAEQEPVSFGEVMEAAAASDAELAPGTHFEPETEQASEPVAEPSLSTGQESPLTEAVPDVMAPQAESMRESMPESEPEPSSERALEPEPAPAAAATAAEPAAGAASPGRPAAPPREPARSPRPPVKTIREAPRAPAQSRRRLPAVLVMLLIIGIAGYGAYWYAGPELLDMVKQKMPTSGAVSGKGLRVMNSTGSIDSSGDLVITGTVENSSDKSIPVWYLVVDVLDTGGTTLAKIRSLSGRQLYTARDYDILTKRGADVQELKMKNREEQGVEIPPMGSAPFELRFLQPPSGIASFVPRIQPYDPERASKELSGGNR